MNENELHFLEHVKSELSLPSSQEAVPLVTSVLQAFRQTLNRQNADELLKRLPDFFKSYFTANWNNEENPVKVDHLDELVTLVMERDTKSGLALFKSEIQTLSVVLLTFKNLFLLMDPRTCAGISVPFYQELSEAVSEIQ